MDDETPDQPAKTNPVDEFPRCGPQCNCGGAKSLGTRGKVIVFLVVAVVAAAVLAYGALRKTGPGMAQADKASPSAALAASPDNMASGRNAMPDSWGAPLESFVKLQDVAADEDAVFVYVPEKERGPEQEITQQIETAAGRTQAGGLKTAFFMLDVDSRDYSRVKRQLSVPCVLAMVKGRGMEVVTSDISEATLTAAMMKAWSSSGGGCCSR